MRFDETDGISRESALTSPTVWCGFFFFGLPMSTQSGWVAAPKGETFEKKCPMCWNGLCKKHPRQDHGASMNFMDKETKSAILAKVYEDKIGAALKQKLAQLKRDEADEEDAEVYRVGCPSPPLP